MKKLIFSLLAIAATTFAFAGTAHTAYSGKYHFAFGTNMIADTTKPGKKSTGTNKDGSPDMRLKTNKDKAAAEAAAKNSKDKVIGKDAKGRTLYEGPKGGHYYIDAKGNKVYVTKDKS